MQLGFCVHTLFIYNIVWKNDVRKNRSGQKKYLTSFLVSAMLSMTRILVRLTGIFVRIGGGGMPLYNRLKEHRARLGVNQQELGRLAGVSRQTISQIERGDYSPSVTLALKLAKICGVQVEDIFTYQEENDHA